MSPSTPAALHAADLTLEEGKSIAFRNISFAVPAGGLLAVVGPVGSGKTSLLLSIAGRMKPTDGELTVAGYALPRKAAAVRSIVALAETGTVNPLDDSLTVVQHIAEAVTLAAPWWRPWARRDEIALVLDDVQALTGDCQFPPLHGRELVSDLSPLTRLLLGVTLALVAGPSILIIDDVDALRNDADRTHAWRALLSLTDSDHPLTLVASCESTRELDAITAGDEHDITFISLGRTPTTTEGR